MPRGADLPCSHATKLRAGDAKSADFALELIGRTRGWVGIGWTQFPGNMIGSRAVIVTESAPNGLGLYRLGGKNAASIEPVSGDEPDFKISNVRHTRLQLLVPCAPLRSSGSEVPSACASRETRALRVMAE